MKLFFMRTISLIVASVMLNTAVAGSLYAQSYKYAANTKITPHEPVIIIKNEKEISAETEGWFSKYKWWLLAGLVVVGGAAAAAGGGGGGGGSSNDSGGGGSTNEGGTITFSW